MHVKFFRILSRIPSYILAYGIPTLLIVVLLANLVPAQTPAVLSETSIEDLQRYQQQIEQYQDSVAQQQERLEQLEQVVQTNILNLELGIRNTETALADNDHRLQLAQASLRKFQRDLIEAQQRYQTEQDKIISRLRQLQRQPRSQGLAALLQSRNLNEFFQHRYRIKLLYEADRQQLINLQTEFVALEQKRWNIERQKNNIALMRQQLLQQKSLFEQQSEAQLTLVERLRTDQRALEAAQTQLAADSESLTQLIQDRIRAQIAQGQSPIVARGDGWFRSPLSGPISSPFGWRHHPILGTSRLHAGIDFAVDYGTPIAAAAQGIVIFSGWYGGYGNAVILDHGGDLTTLYAHTSELLVREGESIRAGQIIATVGSTGLSTGPHLHFEVREKGEPVDPMNYLS